MGRETELKAIQVEGIAWLKVQKLETVWPTQVIRNNSVRLLQAECMGVVSNENQEVDSGWVLWTELSLP